MSSSYSASLVSLLLVSCILVTSAQTTPPLASGLSFDFHRTNCPSLETIIRDYLTEIFRSDLGLASGLLRVHFHDCFVQGCDGSLLLAGSASGPGEQEFPPNLTMRPRAFVVINELRNRIHRACGAIVSCSDISALCARDSVFLSGGPDYRVPLGRRDGVTLATIDDTIDNLPFFRWNISVLATFFENKGLDLTDLVALSGGHTIGRSNCASFADRLYPPTEDPTIDPPFAASLRLVCPSANASGLTSLDVRTPNVFDNQYFVALQDGQGLLNSDQILFTNSTTRPIVTSFANNQTLFFERYVFSIIKMGMMNVLTGTQGQIRTDCSRRNTVTTNLATGVDEQGESAAF